VTGLLFALFARHPVLALLGFACVGAGFATIIPMVFSGAGRTPGIPPGIAMASVATMRYFGFLAGPPFIGFTAELVGLRCALGIIVATSSMIVMLAPAVGRGRSSAGHVLRQGLPELEQQMMLGRRDQGNPRARERQHIGSPETLNDLQAAVAGEPKRQLKRFKEDAFCGIQLVARQSSYDCD
jgi:hypothetical protein